MSKKEAVEEMSLDDFGGEEDLEEGVNEDFSLEDEYKPEPLMPKGKYTGNVTGVKLDTAKAVLAFTIALEGNNGMMTDGTTPIDGYKAYVNIWLPKPSDSTTMTSSGRSTKRQWKINNAKRFADGMKIKMNTINEMRKAVDEGTWIGIPVIVSMKVGKDLNDMPRMEADSCVRQPDED